jgi:type I restriction enzyme S subunit
MTNRTTVGDYVSLVRGVTYKGNLVGKPGPALLGLGSIQPGGGFRDGDYKTYGGECPKKLMLFPGDLFVSLKGATKDGKMIGSVARVPTTVPSGRLTQDTVKLEFRESNREISNFIYWILRTPHYRDYCAGRAMGSAVVALSRDDFLSYPVPVSTSDRSRLVDLLEAFEEKITLNRQMNETLEALAQTIFKSRFMDATATKLPKGWRAGTLGEVAENPRRSIQPDEIKSSMSYIGLEHMPRRSIALSEWESDTKLGSNKLEFKRGEILFGKLRPYFHKVGVAPLDGVCSTDILVVRPKTPEWFSFVLGHVSSVELVNHTDAASTGTKMPRTNWNDLARFEVALPPDSLAAEFTATIRPMIDRIIANIHESRTLAELRDALLPKLLSGELRVPAAAGKLAATRP